MTSTILRKQEQHMGLHKTVSENKETGNKVSCNKLFQSSSLNFCQERVCSVDLLTKSNFIINYYNINCSIIFYYYKQVDYIAEYIITKVYYRNTIVIINIYCTNNHPCPPCLEQ